MRVAFRPVLILVTVLLALAAPLSAATTVPFAFERNKIVIRASINGSRPLRLVLDTGMVNGVLLRSPELARELGLRSERKVVVEGAGDGPPVRADVAFGATVKIGKIELAWQPVIIMPQSSDYAQGSRERLADGVIGHSLFSDHVVEIDHDRKRVTFHDPATVLPADGRVEVPIRIEGRKPYVAAGVEFIDGSRLLVKLVVDTGASNCLYLNPEAHHGIRAPERHVVATLGRGVLGSRRGKVGRIRGLRLGDVVIPDVVTGFPDARIRGMADDRHGLLGNDLLARFNIVFDYGRERMLLQPNRRFDRPIEYDMVGLQFDTTAIGAETFIVHEVLSASPAGRAGIAVGDEVTAIDGQPIAEFTPTEVMEIFRSEVGRELRLDLLRGSRPVAVKLRLDRLI